MRRKWEFVFWILVIIPAVSHAQQGVPRSYTPYYHLWTGFEFQQKISERITLAVDVPYRRQSLERRSLNIFEHFNYVGIRLWTTIRLSEEFYLQLSPFAYFYEVPTTNDPEGLEEWQDDIRFTLRLRYSPESSVISHRYALERRYRSDFEGNKWREFRLRYRLRFNKEIIEGYRLISDDEIY